MGNEIKKILIEDVKNLFLSEFREISDKFAIIEVSLNKAAEDKSEYVWHPGVYVFWSNNKVIKVGRHLENSRKRALDHVTADMHNEEFTIAKLANEEETILLLFNLKDHQDRHWAAALEIFFEERLQPAIKSKRIG